MDLRDGVQRLRRRGVEDWRLAQALGLDLRQYVVWLMTPTLELPPSAFRGFERYRRMLRRTVREALQHMKDADDLTH